VTPGCVPGLNAKTRLQVDRYSGDHVLLYPEGLLKLNPGAVAILELCDGKRSLEEICRRLAARFGVALDVMSFDVEECLEKLRQKGLIELRAPTARP